MNYKVLDFDLPEFLLAEKPIKDGTMDDHRVFVYHTKTLSLIEAIPLDEYPDFEKTTTALSMAFDYGHEKFLMVFHQNNVEATSELDPSNVLSRAFRFYASYLEWEDKNLDDMGL